MPILARIHTCVSVKESSGGRGLLLFVMLIILHTVCTRKLLDRVFIYY